MTTTKIDHCNTVNELLAKNPKLTFDMNICQRVCAGKCLRYVAEITVKMKPEYATIQEVLRHILDNENKHSFLVLYIAEWKKKFA